MPLARWTLETVVVDVGVGVVVGEVERVGKSVSKLSQKNYLIVVFQKWSFETEKEETPKTILSNRKIYLSILYLKESKNRENTKRVQTYVQKMAGLVEYSLRLISRKLRASMF